MASDIFHSNIGVLLHFSIALVMHHRFHAGSYALCETHQIGLGCIHTKSRTRGARHGRKGLGWQHAMHSASGFCRTEPCLEKHPRFFWMHPLIVWVLRSIRGHRRMRLVLLGPLMGSPNFATDLFCEGMPFLEPGHRPCITHRVSPVFCMLHFSFDKAWTTFRPLHDGGTTPTQPGPKERSPVRFSLDGDAGKSCIRHFANGS